MAPPPKDSKPQAPAAPPRVPSVPTVPVVPAIPRVPQAPAAPPRVPSVPPAPAVAAVPRAPQAPAIASVPAIPRVPQAPAIASVPAIPRVPQAPAIASVQAIPAAPVIPAVRAAPRIQAGVGPPQAPPPPGAPPAPQPPSGRVPPIPERGPIERIAPAQAQAIAELLRRFDASDYFEILGLPQSASPADIKRSFYRESRIFHPDRFFHLEDGPAKADLGHLSKRITEAYFVLRDDVRRGKYLADVQGPERAKKLRYTEASESELKAAEKKKVEEIFGTNPKARGFYQSALKDIEAQSWTAAERNLKSALLFESSNARFKEKLAEVQALLEAERKSAGGSFKIK